MLDEPFNRSGLASLDDLSTPLWRSIFPQLESTHNEFIAAQPHCADYPWPRDPLHNCTRVWEYPFVYRHLFSHRSSLTVPPLPQVVDLGSGATFFPFAVAQMGYSVIIMTRNEEPTPSPTVSIGMPVYNGEKYIREALNSLLAQTFTDFELIISDNASTDDTEAICREYVARDPRVRYVRQSENRGAMANFQFVLDEAGGEYFMWAAADDRWDPDWLAALLSQLSAGVSIAFGSVAPFLDSDRLGSKIVPKSLVGPTTIRMLRYYMCRETGAKPCVIYGLYRTAELCKVANDVLLGMTDESWALDCILVFAMLGVGRLRVNPAVVMYKRVPMSGGDVRRRGGPVSMLVRAIKAFFANSRTLWLPYSISHVQHSPRGGTQCAVLAAGPLKYADLVLDWLSGCVAARLPDSVRLTWRLFAGTRTNNWAAEFRRLTGAPTEPIVGRSRRSSG